MDLTWGDEFESTLPQIEAAIKLHVIRWFLTNVCREAAFVAIDCEFTGLRDPKTHTTRPQGRKQTIEERYQDAAAQKVKTTWIRM